MKFNLVSEDRDSYPIDSAGITGEHICEEGWYTISKYEVDMRDDLDDEMNSWSLEEMLEYILAEFSVSENEYDDADAFLEDGGYVVYTYSE